MSILLSHRWEHALIAATIDAATRKCPDCFLGRTAIQKLIYFMKVREIPMKYSFDIHHFGPFCSSVMNDVECLLADDVIEDRSSKEQYSNYSPGPSCSELLDQYKGKLTKFQDIIDDVCEALSGADPEMLELMATLDFSYRWVRARGGNGPWKAESIKKFKSIKKDKFTDEEIENGYETLIDAELVEN